MTQDDFIKISLWASPKLWKYCSRLTVKLGHQAAVDHLMKLRREMHMELAKYAKTHGYDLIQQNAVIATGNMLRWCKEYFMPWATREVIRKFPDKAKNPNSVKYITRQMWEEYAAKFQY